VRVYKKYSDKNVETSVFSLDGTMLVLNVLEF